MKKLVVWIIGGNSVGKTTLAKNIHKFFAELSGKKNTNPVLETFLEDGLEFFYTSFSEYSCNLGNLTKTQCGGTDTLGKKEQIIAAFEKAIKTHPVVIVEGIMATGQWINFLKTPETIVFLVYLKMSPEINFNRLILRRSIKTGVDPDDVKLTQKTMLNLSGKLKCFESLYLRMKTEVDDSISINVDKLKEDQVGLIVRNGISRILNKL